MKVYTVLIMKNHKDPEIKLFRSKEEAIDYAREKAFNLCYDIDDFEERNKADWIYFVQYKCEGDYIRVTEEKID